MWRATPWVNAQENTLNILCVPWPLQIDEECFEPEPETFEPVRYFGYAPPRCDGSHIDDFVELARRVSGTISRLHMLVFPETALTKKDYHELMRRFDEEHRERRLRHVPMIVAGVQNEVEEGSLNEVRLAAYFAGRWYDLSQRKHHRWKLDRDQIRQYGLQGQLSTARDWYETTSIAQRRLTFFAPNGWLTLCPLICEDLGQLEPVSELVRGVGPTLLLALLLDGPQLKERWAARYASVFADDPGSAVLTLTSLGMVKRSRRLEGSKPDEKPSRAVGLWKDVIRGWETLEPGADKHAHLLTISADWTEEHTADGRTDHGFAAAFKFEGARPFPFSKPRKPEHEAVRSSRLEKQDSSDQEHGSRLLRGWEDTRELTAATYALDAAMQLEGDHLETIVALLLGEVGTEFKSRVPKRISELIDLLSTAEKDPASIGVAARGKRRPTEQIERWPTESLRLAAGEIKERLSTDTEASGTVSYWQRLTNEAIERLQAGAHQASAPAASDEEWVPWAVSIAILAALHHRCERSRTRPSPPHGGGTKKHDDAQAFSAAANLLRRIEKALDEYA